MLELIGWFVLILTILAGIVVIVYHAVSLYSCIFDIDDIISELFNMHEHTCPNCKAHCRMTKVEPQYDGYEDFICPKCGHEFHL